MLVIEVWLHHICLEIHDFGVLQLQLELIGNQRNKFRIGGVVSKQKAHLVQLKT